VKGATAAVEAGGHGALVSIHAPVKGATVFAGRAGRSCTGFNPRAREGRDLFVATPDIHLHVSIHAPVKGATLQPRPGFCELVVSIHAPVKGAT